MFASSYEQARYLAHLATDCLGRAGLKWKRKSLQLMHAYGTDEVREDLEVQCEEQGSMLFKRVECMPTLGEKVSRDGPMVATLGDQLTKGYGAFYKNKKQLTLHYAAYLGDVGCKKVASANVESVYSVARAAWRRRRRRSAPTCSARTSSATTTTCTRACGRRCRRSIPCIGLGDNLRSKSKRLAQQVAEDTGSAQRQGVCRSRSGAMSCAAL